MIARTGKGVRRYITAIEFEQIVPLMENISRERTEAARLALVDQIPHDEIAKLYGWSRQSVASAVNRAWESHLTLQRAMNAGADSHLPEGWERVTLVAPSGVIPELRQAIARWVKTRGT